MIRRYGRFIGFLITAIIVTAILWQRLEPEAALLAGFDAGVVVFFISLASLFAAATPDSMRARAEANEPDHHLLVALALAIAAVVIAAVWSEVVAIAGIASVDRSAMLGLAMVSLALAWAFANALGALHYAHLWYLPGADGGDRGGLDFPAGESRPDYWDFTYYTLTLSMTFQVSDVTISNRSLRRLAIGHGLMAFLFNISVIALSVSLATNLLSARP